jgi:hypothetical protein
MRKDVQEIFKATPHEKQVMMFSATLSTEMRAVCKKFMQDPMEIYVDDSKLTLHGLQQHYVKLAENEKNRKLNELLDALEFNQVVVFVKSVQRANALDKLLQVRQPSGALLLTPLALLGTHWYPWHHRHLESARASAGRPPIGHARLSLAGRSLIKPHLGTPRRSATSPRWPSTAR